MALTSFTSVCPLRADVAPRAARHTLSSLRTGTHSPFAASPRTHFARLQVIDELRVHTRRPLVDPVLVCSVDVDGEVRGCLVDVLTASADELALVLGLCVDAPADPAAHDFALRAAEYLFAHELPVGLQYVNSEGPTAIDVRLAVLRRRRLAGFALSHQDNPPAARRAAFLAAFATADAHFAELRAPAPHVSASPSSQSEGVPLGQEL